MFIAPSEHIISYDCDDTLIMWNENSHQPFDGCVQVQCPHDNAITYHRPHKRHIAFLKKQKAKGYTVVVWSSAGTGWASAVVKALGIEQYVDIVMSKPQKWVDDETNPANVLGTRIYLSESGHSV